MPDDGEASFVERDLLLATIYDAHTDAGGEFGISLLVGGQWLTGMTVTGRVWFEGMANEMDTAGQGAGDDVRAVGRMVYPSESEIEAGVVDRPGEDRPIHFIHLRSARRLMDPGGWAPEEGCWLRVRLSQVQAWTIGTLAPPDKAGAFAPLPPPEG